MPTGAWNGTTVSALDGDGRGGAEIGGLLDLLFRGLAGDEAEHGSGAHEHGADGGAAARGVCVRVCRTIVDYRS